MTSCVTNSSITLANIWFQLLCTSATTFHTSIHLLAFIAPIIIKVKYRFFRGAHCYTSSLGHSVFAVSKGHVYDVVSWHVIFGSCHRKYMFSVNASLEAKTALIPPTPGFEVVQSIELLCYYLFLSSQANFIQNNHF